MEWMLPFGLDNDLHVYEKSSVPMERRPQGSGVVKKNPKASNQQMRSLRLRAMWFLGEVWKQISFPLLLMQTLFWVLPMGD